MLTEHVMALDSIPSTQNKIKLIFVSFLKEYKITRLMENSPYGMICLRPESHGAEPQIH